MALDQQRLGGLAMAMLEKLEQMYDPETVSLSGATLVVAVERGPGEVSYHWYSTEAAFHSQLGLLEAAIGALKASSNVPDD